MSLLGDSVDSIHLDNSDHDLGGEVFICSCFVGFLRTCGKRVECSAEDVDVHFGVGHIAHEFFCASFPVLVKVSILTSICLRDSHSQ